METTNTITSQNAYAANGYAPVPGQHLTRPTKPEGYYSLQPGDEYVVMDYKAVELSRVVGERHGNRIKCFMGSYTVYVREETLKEKSDRVGLEQIAAQKSPPVFDTTKTPEDFDDWN